MKGIILAGGSGTRLYPVTLSTNKQLLPVYNKPLVYYPLSILLLAGIRDILIISRPEDRPLFEALLGDGQQLGCRFEYAEQAEPRGLAEAFLIGEAFIGNEAVALILGDNILYGTHMYATLRSCVDRSGAVVFAHRVEDPSPYGVVAFDPQGKVVDIIEKPENPPSNYILVGLYFYPPSVVQVAKGLSPSARGELEITDVNRHYLAADQLEVVRLPRGNTWFDAGSFDDLIEAGNFVQTLEKRQGLQVGCIEEIAYRMGYIDADTLRHFAQPISTSPYGQYLLSILPTT